MHQVRFIAILTEQDLLYQVDADPGLVSQLVVCELLHVGFVNDGWASLFGSAHCSALHTGIHISLAISLAAWPYQPTASKMNLPGRASYLDALTMELMIKAFLSNSGTSRLKKPFAESDSSASGTSGIRSSRATFASA